MNLSFKKIVAVGVISMSTASTHAAVISYGNYSRIDTQNYVEDNNSNLQWLTWTETKGQSINSALANHSDYRLASNIEMANLFTSFFPETAWSTIDNNISNLAGVYNNSDVANTAFLNLFGKTTADNGCVGGIHPISDCNADRLNATGAIFGSDNDGDNRYKIAKVSDEYIFSPSAGLPQQRGEKASFSLDVMMVHNSDVRFGVALVKDLLPQPQPAPISSVPEPASLSLLCLGLLGLGFARKTSKY